MTSTTPTAVDRSTATAPLPLREIVPWAVFAAAVMFALLYFVGLEQGSLSITSGAAVHEFVHDARHLLAFPCH